jgi:hypothetical protein
MLTWSDWKTEPRSNRYHYATRLAKHQPVLFVQPDATDGAITIEESGTSGIQIVHVPNSYDERQSGLIATALNDLGYRRPLLWVYNSLFHRFVAGCYSPLKIFHATEDYFAENAPVDSRIVSTLRSVIAHVDLLIAVSDLVLEHYRERGGYVGESLVLSNGCDYGFWAAEGTTTAPAASARRRDVAFYQGSINRRLDLDLLERLLEELPDWDFWFCGRVDPALSRGWKRLLSFKNLRHLGELKPEEIRSLFKEVSVGIIPFGESEEIYVSMPLKAFEYVAGGLPVVSVPIAALRNHPDLFQIASGPSKFASAMRVAATIRDDKTQLDARKRAAQSQDYDGRFSEFTEWVSRSDRRPMAPGDPCNILILYDAKSIHVNTIREHLRSFALFSRHRVFYAAATGVDTPAADLSLFDVVVVHYCIRINVEGHLSPAYSEALRAFAGLKLLFLQDEYDTTESARRAIEYLGIQVVYTCVSDRHIADVYPPQRFPSVDFIPTLTGFVPIGLKPKVRPLRERPHLIAYRGRSLAYWYGDLGQEKLVIGQRMKQICQARGLTVDIEWDDTKRIYGEAWYDFLQSARATLGTESGSNVFDDHGDVRKAVEDALQHDPGVSYSDLRPTLIAPHEGRITMNQISPKVFEAIACRTALVLFEGTYSGVVKPNVHFIPLKKDSSNVDEVLTKLQDDDFVERMTERAWQDVIGSGRYSYQTFIDAVDSHVDRRIRIGRGQKLFAILSAPGRQIPIPQSGQKTFAIPTHSPLNPAEWAVVQSVGPTVESPGEVDTKDLAKFMWRALPDGLRSRLRPFALWLLGRLS